MSAFRLPGLPRVRGFALPLHFKTPNPETSKAPLRISAGSRPVVTRGNRKSCAKGPKEPGLAAEGIAVISRCESDSVSTLVPARSKWRWEEVVETSPHSLIVRYGGFGRQSARDGPVCWFFFQRSHAESSTNQRSLHMLTQHLMAQLPPCKSHAKLRWCLTKDFRPSLTEGTPCLGGPSTPLLGEFS
jgi:hypothetical protein